MKRYVLILFGLLVLASCGIAPVTIDLLPMLGNSASGERPIAATGNLDLKLPDEDGEKISGYETIQLKPSMVSLEYQLDLSQNGNLTGNAEMAFYLASPEGFLWDDENQLGEAKEVNMSLKNQTVSGTLSLNPAQIDALMAGEIAMGAKVTGNVTGSATLSYEFKRLILKVAFF